MTRSIYRTRYTIVIKEANMNNIYTSRGSINFHPCSCIPMPVNHAKFNVRALISHYQKNAYLSRVLITYKGRAADYIYWEFLLRQIEPVGPTRFAINYDIP